MNADLGRLVAGDVAFCQAMVNDMQDYFKSDVLFWEPSRRSLGGADLPKLTVGGLLLAMHRLATLSDRLTPEQSALLAQAEQALAGQKSEWRIRYQRKLARELRSRQDSWAWYLDDCRRQGESAVVHYPRQVEIRVKIDLLLAEAHEVGLDVEASRQRQTGLDRRLRADWLVGEFCWPNPLTPGFSPERFWYLWGRLVCRNF